MPEDETRLRARFTELLLNAPTRDLREGFDTARRLGPAAAPVLWTLVAAEKSNMKRRMAVLAAACLAEGEGGDERVLQRLDERSPLQDRLVSCVHLALGPKRVRRPQEFWPHVLGSDRNEPEPLLLVAALLASSRFPETGSECPSGLLRVENPGVTAAAVYAGAPVSDTFVQNYLRPRPPAHATFVQRAQLLRALPTRPGEVLPNEMVERAAGFVQASGEGNATLRDAAALVLSAGDAIRAEGLPRPEWRLLQLYAAEPKAAGSMQSWLPPEPSPLDEPARTRLAVAYVMSRSVDDVVADRAVWGAVASIRRHVAVALALRLCATTTAPIRTSQVDLPEWGFVRWASGDDAKLGSGFDDPLLAQGAVLADAGRLSREAAARLLEDTLWRWGSHPGLGRFTAHHEFVRDLILSGSLPGNRYAIGVADHLRYLPAGLGNENDFFWLAVELYEFVKEPTLPIPPECRLR